MILVRLTGDPGLERQLDKIKLVPGFSYAEDMVGTNGIGTALDPGGPAHVSATSTTRSDWRDGLRRVPSATRYRADRRRHRLDLLAARCRPADAVPWPRPPPLRSTRRWRPPPATGTCGCCRSTTGLPAYRRDRAGARQRRRDAQRHAGAPWGRATGALIPRRRRRSGGVSRGPSPWTAEADGARMFCHAGAPGPDDGVSDGVVHVKLVAGTRSSRRTTGAPSCSPALAASLAEVPRRVPRCRCPPGSARAACGGPAVASSPLRLRGVAHQ